jgi:hypothetical protein
MFRIMEDRKTKVETAKNFFWEYLRLMNHYELLDKT